MGIEKLVGNTFGPPNLTTNNNDSTERMNISHTNIPIRVKGNYMKP
jgi:hypothetical protein